MNHYMAETARNGPWKICRLTASNIVNLYILPVLLAGHRLSEKPENVRVARRLAQVDSAYHELVSFEPFFGGPAASPKEKNRSPISARLSYSKKSFNLRALVGCFSLRMALASI